MVLIEEFKGELVTFNVLLEKKKTIDKTLFIKKFESTIFWIKSDNCNWKS